MARKLTLGEKYRLRFQKLEEEYVPEEIVKPEDLQKQIIEKINDLAETEKQREEMLKAYNLITQKIYMESINLQALQRKLKKLLRPPTLVPEDYD